MVASSRSTSIPSKKNLRVMKRIKLEMRMKSSRCTPQPPDLRECKLELAHQQSRMNLSHPL
jgi:hypothetical protein